MGDDGVIVLVTSVPSTTIIEGNQTLLRNMFKGRKIDFRELDGMDQSKKEERNKLFGISSKRGVYPQVFMEIGGEVTFVGDFEEISQLNECDALPTDVLAANPQIKTLSNVFKPFL